MLCDVLCFLSNKFGKTSVKTLKSAVHDFYTVEKLSEAKIRLIQDIDTADLMTKRPHMPLRRDIDGRITREVDDIILLYTFLDEQKALDKLPKYVSDNADNMPSLRIYEGDLNVLTSLLHAMGGRLSHLESVLAAISDDVRKVQVWPSLPTPAQPSSYTNVSTDINNRQSNKSTACQSAVQQAKRSEIPSCKARESADINPANSRSQTSERASDGYSWSARMSTPNRYAVLASDDDDHDDATDGDGDGERLFTVVRPRHGKRNRQPTSPQATQAQLQQGEQPRRQRAPVVAGRSSVVGNKIAAAKILRKKAACSAWTI